MTNTMAATILLTIGILILLGTGSFAIMSIRENEKRAARISFFLVVGAVPFFILSTFPLNVKLVALWGTAVVIGIGVVLFLLPFGRVKDAYQVPASRIDERDIMFARANLEPGSPQHTAYYQLHPENKPSDDLTRTKPGLYSLDSKFADPILFASCEASFDLTHHLRGAVEGPVAPTKQTHPEKVMTAYIKNLAKYYGALEVGITKLQPYHVYSHIGRGAGTYGDPIPTEHKYAVAITVEMNYDMIGSNPTAPGSMESAHQYVESARVAIQLAAAIRRIGFPARAHIDGNYRVICPLVARDAGLGELSRMGLLITPSHGPRVRIAVITTDLNLVTDTPLDGSSVIDFCTICKKCATNCPSQSIPTDERVEIDGAFRWQIDSDSCFRYWNIAGTDCGRCMTVCPYAHPANIYHDAVRWGIARSGIFRRFANRMDDILYGKNPAQREAPHWTKVL
jgi:reductive dehalogenase